MNKHISVYILLFLSMMMFATAVTINSVSVDPSEDVFYSSYSGNNVVHLIVNVTGANESSAVAVTANFVDFEVNGVSPCPIVSLINAGGDIWTGSCDIGAGAGALANNNLKSGKVLVIANETYGSSNSNSDLTIAIYNLDIAALTVPAGACYKFGAGSTNFNQETNFNNFDITLVIEANDDSACITQGHNWGSGWLKVSELKFTSVNFNNNVVDAKKIEQLSNIVKLKFASSGTYQNTRLSIDTTQLPELNVNSFNVKLYHLSI